MFLKFYFRVGWLTAQHPLLRACSVTMLRGLPDLLLYWCQIAHSLLNSLGILFLAASEFGDTVATARRNCIKSLENLPQLFYKMLLKSPSLFSCS